MGTVSTEKVGYIDLFQHHGIAACDVSTRKVREGVDIAGRSNLAILTTRCELSRTADKLGVTRSSAPSQGPGKTNKG